MRLLSDHNGMFRLLACIVTFVCIRAAAGQTRGTFTATGGLITACFSHTTALLFDGRVLIAGGSRLANAEIYDPSTEMFTATGNMAAPRWEHTATLLPNNDVLIAGGYRDGLVSAELYDPVTGKLTATVNMVADRWGHGAILLADGRVLIAGGFPPGIIGSVPARGRPLPRA